MAWGEVVRGLWRRGGRQKLAPHDAYAMWAGQYPPRPHNPLMEAEQAAVAPILASMSPGRALDVGTGTGRYLPLLAAAGARLVVGVDLSQAMLGHRRFAAPCIRGDAQRLPFASGSFDLVCSSLMAGDLPDLRAWVAEAARVLAARGHLVYSDFHPSWSSRRWRRTFRAADGRLIELSYFPHAIEEHLALMTRASLRVRAVREPRVPGQATPAVVVFHAAKTTAVEGDAPCCWD
jgi:malonyl-CoA O-methyltransferase